MTGVAAEALPLLERLASGLSAEGLAAGIGESRTGWFVAAHHPDARALGERYAIVQHAVDGGACWVRGSRSGLIGPTRRMPEVVHRAAAVLAPQVPHLLALIAAAQEHGWRASLIEPIGRPPLARISPLGPDADHVEDVVCLGGWLCWSWGEPLAPVHAVPVALSGLAGVFGSREGHRCG